MSDLDLLDHELKQTFERAHESPQWASPNWPDPVARVRRAATRARARRFAAATAAAVAVAGVAVVSAAALTRSDDQVRYAPASGGGTTGQTGAQWLLSPNDYSQYAAAHPSPSAAPDTVASPAPLDAELAQLQRNVTDTLPADVSVVRTDAADGGARGHATMWLRLADGTPVAVERSRLSYPLVVGGPDEVATNGEPPSVSEHFTDPASWPDGTAYTVLTGNELGYGFGPDTQWSGPTVWTVTPDGWFTMWTAPVPSAQLLSWARGADAAFAAGG